MWVNDYYDPRYDQWYVQWYDQCDTCDILSNKEAICDLKLKKNEANYDVEIFSALKSENRKINSDNEMIFFSDL